MSVPDITLVVDISVVVLSASYAFLDTDLTNGLLRAHTSQATLAAATYVILRLIYSTLIYPTYIDPLRHIPLAPQESILAGFFTGPLGPECEEWINTIPNTGLIRYRGRLNSPQVLVTTPAGCEAVLQTKAAAFPKGPSVRKILHMWLGKDTLLSCTNGDGHKTLRKRLLPVFYARNIRELQPVMWGKALQMCEALHRIVKYNNDRVLEVNLDDVIDRAALDVVGLAGLGVDFDTLRSPDGKIGNLHKKAFDLGDQETQVVLSALFLPEWLFTRLPFRVYQENRAGVQALRAHCRAVIRDELAAKSGNVSASGDNLIAMAAHMDRFDEDDLVDLSMDLLVAGHKTSCSALQLAFYTLAQHPDIQNRLRQEIRRAYPHLLRPDASSPPDPTTDPKLPYLDAVLNELLRLYPPVAIMVRLSASPATLGDDPVLVPAGTNVAVSMWAMNRARALWGSDAAVFRPERWLDEDGDEDEDEKGSGDGAGAGNRKRPHLLTFSRGPRNCIGEGFARRELGVLVGAVVARFELSIVLGDEEDGTGGGGRVRQVVEGITLRVKGGCRVGVKELVD